ncbi:MAG: heparinase II/III family protein [Pseudomonadota bacterium]
MSASSVGRLLRAVRVLARTYGVRGLTRRAWHELRKRLGWYRASPKRASVQPAPGGFSYAPPDRAFVEIDVDAAAQRGQRVLADEYQAYGAEWRAMPRTTDQWTTHPKSGVRFSRQPWWEVPLYVAGSDIKDVWEPSRFAWAYDLVRAYRVTKDTAYASRFYELTDEWLTANPPFLGPNWACGQETAIRALAVLHGIDGLPPDQTDAGYLDRANALLCWSGERIADGIGYGLSQRNNHGISEAAGLIHLGFRFHGTHPGAARWLRLGTRLVCEQIADQFYADGWYSQHSFTYMRVALEQALLVERVLKLHQRALPVRITRRLDAAVGLLSHVVHADLGTVPNHGANDGGRVLPWSMATYRDFRPLLTFASLVREIPLPEDIAADSGVLWWLGAPRVTVGPRREDDLTVGASGWLSARIGGSSVFAQAGSFRHRPSHLDYLHIHVSIDGVEVITDPGTFSYNSEPPWSNGLAGANVHNGPVLDHKEYAARGARFLWLSWPEAHIARAERTEDAVCFIARRDGEVERRVKVQPGSVQVTDTALRDDATVISSSWLTHPSAAGLYDIESSSVTQVETKASDVGGWYSPTYGVRIESDAVVTSAELAICPRLETTIRLRRGGSSA